MAGKGTEASPIDDPGTVNIRRSAATAAAAAIRWRRDGRQPRREHPRASAPGREWPDAAPGPSAALPEQLDDLMRRRGRQDLPVGIALENPGQVSVTVSPRTDAADSSSNRTHPKAQTSDRPPAGCPRTCSGSCRPACRDLALDSRTRGHRRCRLPGASNAAAATFASPKSRTLTRPSASP